MSKLRVLAPIFAGMAVLLLSPPLLAHDAPSECHGGTGEYSREGIGPNGTWESLWCVVESHHGGGSSGSAEPAPAARDGDDGDSSPRSRPASTSTPAATPEPAATPDPTPQAEGCIVYPVAPAGEPRPCFDEPAPAPSPAPALAPPVTGGVVVHQSAMLGAGVAGIILVAFGFSLLRRRR